MPDDPPTEIDGIAVKNLSEWKQELQQLQNQQLLQDTKRTMILPKYYLIAVPEAHHQIIVKNLHSLNLFDLSIEDSQIILLTNELENKLMEVYYSSLADCMTVSKLLQPPERAISQISHQESDSPIQIFQAKSHMDKPLKKINPIGMLCYRLFGKQHRNILWLMRRLLRMESSFSIILIC